jgi:acyl-[acyl carrier protein]--UDP-N-acetylglucosamine O-acyltransferase
MEREHDYDDVDARWAEIDESAHISSSAVVGSPGETRGRPTRFPAVIGARAVVREFARVHAGCDRKTVVGAGTLLMSGSQVSHDAVLGVRVHLAPNVVVGEAAEVGDHSHIGIGAVVLAHMRIGRNCIVGGGSVVSCDIPDGQVWAGVPATYRKDVERAAPE